MNLVSKNNVCQGLFKHDLHWKVGGHAPEYVMKKQKTVKISTKEEAEDIFDLYISADAELFALSNLSKDRSVHYTDADEKRAVCAYIRADKYEEIFYRYVISQKDMSWRDNNTMSFKRGKIILVKGEPYLEFKKKDDSALILKMKTFNSEYVDSSNRIDEKRILEDIDRPEVREMLSEAKVQLMDGGDVQFKPSEEIKALLVKVYMDTIKREIQTMEKQMEMFKKSISNVSKKVYSAVDIDDIIL